MPTSRVVKELMNVCIYMRKRAIYQQACGKCQLVLYDSIVYCLQNCQVCYYSVAKLEYYVGMLYRSTPINGLEGTCVDIRAYN